MNERSTSVAQYQCDECHTRFEIVMTFREAEPFDRDEQGNWRPTGYPEEQPECPQCHCHDVIRVDTRAVD